jgi:hypothetical protein
VVKVLTVQGSGNTPGSMPRPDIPVTIVARDSAGVEVRSSFVVRYTRAYGKPRVRPEVGVARLPVTYPDPRLNAAQLEFEGSTGAPGMLPEVQVTFSEANPRAGINWHPLDPETEILCVYGGFRYACDAKVDGSRLELPPRVTALVPDIGRGQTVAIVLKNPYGESAPVSVQVDTVNTYAVRRRIAFTSPAAGEQIVGASPAIRGHPLLVNAGSRSCNKPYLQWVDLTSDGKIYETLTVGALPIQLKFMGDAKIRVVSVPRGSLITDDPETGWAKIGIDIPAGLAQAYAFDLQYRYRTLVGECPDRRR